MEAAAGEQRAGDVRASEGADVAGGDFFKMVSACGVHFDGEFCRAGARELLCVDAQTQSAGPRGGKNFARLRHGEGATVAEHVAELGKIFGCDTRQPLVADKIHVSVRRLASAMAIFMRDNVRAKKSANDIKRLFAFQFAKNHENLALTFPREAVTGFGFERGGSMRGELRQMRERAMFQISGRRSAKFLRTVVNSAASAGDFFVSSAGNALFVFRGARDGMD